MGFLSMSIVFYSSLFDTQRISSTDCVAPSLALASPAGMLWHRLQGDDHYCNLAPVSRNRAKSGIFESVSVL